MAYATTITDLDPLRYNLLFERFLNPERVSMPDFDIDFCQDRREEVIRYVQSKYGTEQVAQIITFGTLQARAVLRDVGRVLQMPYGQVDRICKLVPANPADPWSIERTMNEVPAVQADGRGGRDGRPIWSPSPAISRACSATPRPMPPASSSATGRCRIWRRSIAIRARTCRSANTT